MRAKGFVTGTLIALLAVALPVWAGDEKGPKGGGAAARGGEGGGARVSAPAPSGGGHVSGGGHQGSGPVGAPHGGIGPATPRVEHPRAEEAERNRAGVGHTRGGRPVIDTAVPRGAAPPVPATNLFYFPSYGYGLYPYGSFGMGYFFYDPFYFDPFSYGYQSGGYYGSSATNDQGAIRLKVKPKSAQVFVDGYYYGIVDEFDGIFQKLKLDEGTHRIEIRADGYKPLIFDVRIRAGHTTTYEGRLEPLGGAAPNPR